VKPAGNFNSAWSEAAKYEFSCLALNHALYAVVKGVEQAPGAATPDDMVASQISQVLSLHLVDTSLPDQDVVISDALLAVPYLGVVADA
jgi:hypothetical protein